MVVFGRVYGVCRMVEKIYTLGGTFDVRCAPCSVDAWLQYGTVMGTRRRKNHLGPLNPFISILC